MIPQFHGQLVAGKFTLNNRQVFDAYCKGLKNGAYYLELHKRKGPPKTLEQLGYYFAVIIPTVKQAMVEHGNDYFVVKVGDKFKELPINDEVVDQLLKEACAKFDGKIVNKADMTKEQASEFIDRCIRWAARYLGCVIPEPEK